MSSSDSPPPREEQPLSNFKIPEKATIRLEFIKTKNGGKAGPYYYAYWRENRKLEKKYLGKNLPAEFQETYNQKREDPKYDNTDIAIAMNSMFY